MRNKGSLYVGLMLLAFGGYFLLASVTQGIGGFLGRFLGYDGLWPVLILLVALGFWLPILVWWDRHSSLAGLAVPGTIVGVNGLLLLFQNWTGLWNTWAYMWALEPMSVGLGLLALYWLMDSHPQELRVAAGIVGGIGAALFLIFASFFGGVIRWVGPLLLVLVGALVVLRGLGLGMRPRE